MTSTLLLADSNPTIQRIVAMTFAGEDMRVVSVSDGDQAIARIRSDRPDIVLADVSMAKRSGYDVAAFVKGQPELAHIPVLLLAGALEPVDERRAAEVRCDGVLVKPFEPQQVVARVLELVRGAKGSPRQTGSGVPRPIDRLIESRTAAPAEPGTREEPPSKVVKHPSVPAPLPPGQAAASAPAAPAAPPAADDPLGDYFDQLDAAFDNLDPPRPSDRRLAGTPEDETERLDVPTLTGVLGEFGRDTAPAPRGHSYEPPHEAPPAFKDQILFTAPPVEPPDIRVVPPVTLREIPTFTNVRGPAPAPPEPEPGPSFDLDLHTAAGAFDALLTVDRQAREEELPTTVPPPQPEPAPVVTEALIDAIATRVVERLAPDGVTDLVSRVVTDVAERLVREEIDRIRGRK